MREREGGKGRWVWRERGSLLRCAAHPSRHTTSPSRLPNTHAGRLFPSTDHLQDRAGPAVHAVSSAPFFLGARSLVCLSPSLTLDTTHKPPPARPRRRSGDLRVMQSTAAARWADRPSRPSSCLTMTGFEKKKGGRGREGAGVAGVVGVLRVRECRSGYCTLIGEQSRAQKSRPFRCVCFLFLQSQLPACVAPEKGVWKEEHEGRGEVKWGRWMIGERSAHQRLQPGNQTRTKRPHASGLK